MGIFSRIIDGFKLTEYDESLRTEVKKIVDTHKTAYESIALEELGYVGATLGNGDYQQVLMQIEHVFDPEKETAGRLEAMTTYYPEAMATYFAAAELAARRNERFVYRHVVLLSALRFIKFTSFSDSEVTECLATTVNQIIPADY